MTELRWDLADADQTQGALWSESIFEREPGRGEFRGMEFLHVRARTIINEVKGGEGYLPFRYTINAYRGCSHACSYCVVGETEVSLADGRTRPIGDLRIGDHVVGTEGGRVAVPTPILDHWATHKAAFRVRTADRRELVASADHRLLTSRGWRAVGALRPSDHLVLDPLRSYLRQTQATAQWTSTPVVAVEPLRVDLPMFDITTGTGDFIANGVVSHNCFARPTHAYLNLDTGRDFERRIVVKVNAVERLRIELDRRRWAGEHIAMGTNTDPYQRCEGKYRLTRGIVEVLTEAANPFSILTKGTLVLRDLELLAEAAKRTSVRVNLSIGTLDEEVWKTTEPGTPHPMQRVRAVEQLNQAGVPCGVLVAPVLPGLSDRVDQLEAVVDACLNAGAVSISTVLLHLRPGVKENYIDSLRATHPQLVRSTQRLYGARSRAPKDDQRRVADLVHELVRRKGGITAPRLDANHMTGRAAPIAVPAPMLGRRRAGPVEGQLNLL